MNIRPLYDRVVVRRKEEQTGWRYRPARLQEKLIKVKLSQLVPVKCWTTVSSA